MVSKFNLNLEFISQILKPYGFSKIPQLNVVNLVLNEYQATCGRKQYNGHIATVA